MEDNVPHRPLTRQPWGASWVGFRRKPFPTIPGPKASHPRWGCEHSTPHTLLTSFLGLTSGLWKLLPPHPSKDSLSAGGTGASFPGRWMMGKSSSGPAQPYGFLTWEPKSIFGRDQRRAALVLLTLPLPDTHNGTGKRKALNPPLLHMAHDSNRPEQSGKAHCTCSGVLYWAVPAQVSQFWAGPCIISPTAAVQCYSGGRGGGGG